MCGLYPIDEIMSEVLDKFWSVIIFFGGEGYAVCSLTLGGTSLMAAVSRFRFFCGGALSLLMLLNMLSFLSPISSPDDPPWVPWNAIV